MFHFSAVCFIERYAIIVLLVSQKGIISRILLYSKLRGKSILLAPSGAQYFVHLGLFPLILANWQAGCAGALSGISIPKTCWDNPNPLSIIAGDGYAFLRNAIEKLHKNAHRNLHKKRHRIAARRATIRIISSIFCCLLFLIFLISVIFGIESCDISLCDHRNAE